MPESALLDRQRRPLTVCLPLLMTVAGAGTISLAYSWDLLRGSPVIHIGRSGVVATIAGVMLCLGALLRLPRLEKQGRLGRLVAFATLPLASTTLLLTLAESSLRLAHYGRREAAFGRSLELVHKPYEAGFEGGRPFHLNAFGFRDNDFPRDKPSGELRVLCLGDSSTFGFAVDRDDAYPHVLEQILRRRLNRRIEVINAGYVSATSYQGWLLYRRIAGRFGEDYVTMAFGHNDRWLRPLPDDRGGTGKPLALLLQLRVRILLTRTIARLLPPRSKSYVPRVAPSRYQSNLARLASLAKDEGAKPILLSLPDNPEILEAPERARRLISQGKMKEAFRLLREATRIRELNPYPEAFDLLAEVGDTIGSPKVAARARHEAAIRRRLAPRARNERAYRQAVLSLGRELQVPTVVFLPDCTRGHQIDICHPDVSLHRRIAAALAETILAGVDYRCDQTQP